MLRTFAFTSTAIGVALAGLVVAASSGCPQTVGGGEGEGEGEGAHAGEGEGEGTAVGEGEGSTGEGEGEGEGGGACAPVPTCTAAPTSSLAFTNVGGNPALVVDNGAPIAIGTTRASVEGAIGTGTADGAVGGAAGNVFHVDYCAGGFQIQYVDGDGNFDSASANGAGTDVVARIQTLAGASLTPPNATADATFNAGGDAIHIASTAGVETIEDANATLLSVVLFKPQANAAAWSLAFDDTPNGQKLGALTVGNGNFSDVKNALGAAFDADGTADISLGAFGSITVRTLIYASTGIRVAGICGNDCSDGNVSLNTIVLSPPFFGADTHGLAIGALESDVDAAGLGTKSGPDNNGVTVYGSTGLGQSPTGVAFVQAPDCSNVAAAFILGYTTQ